MAFYLCVSREVLVSPHVTYSPFNKFCHFRLDNLFVVADAVILRMQMGSLIYKEYVHV